MESWFPLASGTSVVQASFSLSLPSSPIPYTPPASPVLFLKLASQPSLWDLQLSHKLVGWDPSCLELPGCGKQVEGVWRSGSSWLLCPCLLASSRAVSFFIFLKQAAKNWLVELSRSTVRHIRQTTKRNQEPPTFFHAA